MAGDPDKAWFVHYYDGRRMKAVPLKLQGWLALLALILLPLLTGLWASKAFAGSGPAPFIVTMVISLALVWMATIVLLHYRSRPRG